jgi:hypothetical protein
MKFKDTNFSKSDRYSIGVEEESGKYYISIPVRNNYVDYEEYYEISKSEFEYFSIDIVKAKDLANRCRERTEDKRLMYQPSNERGWPT